MTTRQLPALHTWRRQAEAPLYLMGVDGGGSGTRARLAGIDGRELSLGRAGASGLSLGIDAAWAAVEAAVADALLSAGLAHVARSQIALGIGVAGAMNDHLAQAFIAKAPAFAAIALDSDAFTTLLGAHGGCAGAVLSIGTGCVGLAWRPGGARHLVSGWGFPSGDEGSGAWMGLRALTHLERTLDGREPAGALARVLAAACGSSRPALVAWLSTATQTDFAALAPAVLACADEDGRARAIVQEASRHIEQAAQALDPQADLPLALCSGLAAALRPHLAPDLVARTVPPAGDAAQGALQLITSNWHHGPAIS